MAIMQRREFLERLSAMAAGFRARIEAEVDGFPLDRAAQRARRERAAADFGYFCATYFPHYIRSPHRSQLHDYLFQRLPEIVSAEDSQTDAIAAPRGEAKSTLVSQLFVLWCVLTGRKRYPVIVMDSIDQAYPMLEAIKAELEFNPRLTGDFEHATGQGRVWQAGTILTRNDAKIQVAGSGKKLRGLRHGPYRPDLCVLDDIENDENVRSADQRDKLHGWLTKTVLPLGGAGQKFDVVYIGTILHYDSVLSRTLSNPLWTSARFRAVLRWPDRMDLWDRWEELLRNDGPAVAEAFWHEHQADMERGAEVSWAARPILRLMKIRARDGHQAFDSEYQNDPVSGEHAPFANSLTFWVNRLPEWQFFGAVDPSMGKSGARRDPSAILVGGRNPKTRVLDVVEAGIRKRLPDRIIEDVIALQAQYHCLLWVVEAVQFQEFLYTELVRRARESGVPVPARPVKPAADKELRIESLQPHLAAGSIRLHPSQTTLIDQLRHWPRADHDDGPDALQMLWAAACSGVAATSGYQGARRVRRGLAPWDDDGQHDTRRMF